MSRDLEPPRSMTTYKRADGEPIAREYGWVTDLEYFEEDYEPTKYICEDWLLVNRTVIWIPDHGVCQECGDDVTLPSDYDGKMLLTCDDCLAAPAEAPRITKGEICPDSALLAAEDAGDTRDHRHDGRDDHHAHAD